MNVRIPREFEKLVERLVETGRYTSAAEVVSEALRLLHQREKARKLARAEIRKEIEKGLRESRRGDHRDGDRVFEKLEAYILETARKKRA